MTTATFAAELSPARREKSRPLAGLSAIALAIAFNVPFSVLAATFQYPDVLRRPAGEVLDLFNAGGAGLILTWHAFALTALAMAPMGFALSLTPARIAAKPALAVGAAVSGALAGLAQAIGLWRWVFVVPGLAHTHASAASSAEAKRAAEQTFELINQYGGVAIGEHMGQTLTALFAALVSAMQWGERKFVSAGAGFVTTAVLMTGTCEGVAMAIGGPSEMFATATVVGFMGLTLWLVATGIGLLRGAPQRR